MITEIAIPDRTFLTRSETTRTRQRPAWPGTAAACAIPPATPWLRATPVYFTAMNFLAIFCSFFLILNTFEYNSLWRLRALGNLQIAFLCADVPTLRFFRLLNVVCC